MCRCVKTHKTKREYILMRKEEIYYILSQEFESTSLSLLHVPLSFVATRLAHEKENIAYPLELVPLRGREKLRNSQNVVSFFLGVICWPGKSCLCCFCGLPTSPTPRTNAPTRHRVLLRAHGRIVLCAHALPRTRVCGSHLSLALLTQATVPASSVLRSGSINLPLVSWSWSSVEAHFLKLSAPPLPHHHPRLTHKTLHTTHKHREE